MIEDWRDLDPGEVEPLYEAECRRYRTALAWEFDASCRIIEQARRSGRLPGLVLRLPGGAIAGWTYFVVSEGVLQIGGLVADSASHLRRLLGRVLQSPEAAFARGLTAFVFPVSSSLQAAFERQRFAVERHAYLSRSITIPGAPGGEGARAGFPGEYRLRRLGEVDPANVVRLTARSYAGMAEARCFAPDGRLDQWAHYLGQLLATPACGVYLPGASFALERRETGQLGGAVITTAIAPGTAHIAQIVVDPACRRAGLAAALVSAALESARDDGCSDLSLLVADANAPARSLYARLGFRDTASFIFASRAALSRRVTTPVPSPRALIGTNLGSTR
jgi:ribosomal protein S18 acetylase RimI-like enzyme